MRPKYVVPVSEVNDTIITASLPPRFMEKCMFGEGLLAQIMADKYCDHLPLYSQAQRFKRAGVEIATIVFLSIAVFHKRWIKQNAEKYAEKLFSIYLLDK